MKRKNSKGFIIVLIAGIVTAGILATLGYLYFRQSNTLLNEPQKTEADNTTPKDSEDLLASYVNETRYIGGIGYPIVYNIPFGKDEYYKTNKALWEEEEVDIDICVSTAQKFAETLFNSSYRTIQEDDDLYRATLLDLMDRDFFYEEDEQGNGYTEWEYIEKIEKYITDNEIEMESKFKTDSSLVYADGYYLIHDIVYVRGMLEYEVFSSKGERLPVSKENQPKMLEITLHRNNENPNKYDVIAFNFIN